MPHPVAFDEFCRDLLGAWPDEPVAADATGRTPTEVAKRALFTAAVEKKTGIVLVAVPGAAEQRLVQSYVDAMADRQSILRDVLGRIQVTTMALAPLVQGVVHTIQMSDASLHEDAPMGPGEVRARVMHILLTETIETPTAQALAMMRVLDASRDPVELLRELRGEWEERAASHREAHAKEWRDAQRAVTGSNNLPKEAFKQPAPVIIGGVDQATGMYTPEANAAIAERKIVSQMSSPRPEVITLRKGRRRGR